MRARRLVPLGAALVLTLLAAAPASALVSDTLSISVPSPKNLGTVTPGESLSAQLGTVKVTADTTLLTGWVATVSLSPFTVTQAGQTWTFPSSRVTYSAGLGTPGLGLGVNVCSPGVPGSLEAVRTAFVCGQILSLTSSLSWNPTITVSTQATDPAGTYTGTITHSVS